MHGALDLDDPLTFSATYRRLAPVARRTAMGVLGEPAAAEDVVQEVFTRLWERPKLYDPSRGPLEALVRVMARTRAMDLRRSQTTARAGVDRLGAQLTTAAPDLDADPEAVALRRATRRRLLRALDDLRPEQREAVLATHVAGLTAAELATRRGIPLGTAKSRVRAGLRGLAAAA